MKRNMAVHKPGARIVKLESNDHIISICRGQEHVPSRRIIQVEWACTILDDGEIMAV